MVLGVPTARTFARTFTIPLNQIHAVKDAVNLEVDQYVPMPLESLYVDYEIIKKTDKEATVLMCAIPKPFLDNTLEIIRRHDIDVAMIEPSVNAVARVLKRTEEGTLPTVIVDIGPTSTDIAVLDGAVRVTGSLGVGGNTFTLAIADQLDVALENAHQLKVINGLSSGPRRAKIQQALKPSLQRIITETKKVVRYYTERFSGEGKIEQVLVVGSGNNVPGIGDYFTNALVMPARVASPWQALDFGDLEAPTKQLRARYITAVGLGMVNPKEI